MPLQPFPLPLTIGNDICHSARILSILTTPRSRDRPKDRKRAAAVDAPSSASRLLRIVLTEREIEENKRRLKPAWEWENLSRKRGLLQKKWADLGVTKSAVLGRRRRIAEKDGAVGGKWKLEGAEMVVRPDDVDLSLSVWDEIEGEGKRLMVGLKPVAEFLAGRFAAKEAAIKAHRSRRLKFQDIAILSGQVSEATYMSTAPTAQIRPEDGNWENAHVVPMSISHDGGYATAVCLAYEPFAAVMTPPEYDGKGLGSWTGADSQRRIVMGWKAEPIKTGALGGEERPGEYRTSMHMISKADYNGVFVRGIPERAGNADLLWMFSRTAGGLKGYICRDADGGSLGCGWVIFRTQGDAMRASKRWDRTTLMSREIRCTYGGHSKIDEIVKMAQEGYRGEASELGGEENLVKMIDPQQITRKKLRLKWAMTRPKRGALTTKEKMVIHVPSRFIRPLITHGWLRIGSKIPTKAVPLLLNRNNEKVEITEKDVEKDTSVEYNNGKRAGSEAIVGTKSSEKSIEHPDVKPSLNKGAKQTNILRIRNMKPRNPVVTRWTNPGGIM